MEITNEKPTKGIAVDGYCKGNPGPGGYRGVDIETGEVLFKYNTVHCTNNIAEFLGIVHALMYIKKFRAKGYNTVYTDSEIAMAWVGKKACGTKFEKERYVELCQRIFKCEMFLVECKSLPSYRKWITAEWGEIPADFGNKRQIMRLEKYHMAWEVWWILVYNENEDCIAIFKIKKK